MKTKTLILEFRTDGDFLVEAFGAPVQLRRNSYTAELRLTGTKTYIGDLLYELAYCGKLRCVSMYKDSENITEAFLEKLQEVFISFPNIDGGGSCFGNYAFMYDYIDVVPRGYTEINEYMRID